MCLRYRGCGRACRALCYVGLKWFCRSDMTLLLHSYLHLKNWTEVTFYFVSTQVTDWKHSLQRHGYVRCGEATTINFVTLAFCLISEERDGSLLWSFLRWIVTCFCVRSQQFLPRCSFLLRSVIQGVHSTLIARCVESPFYPASQAQQWPGRHWNLGMLLSSVCWKMVVFAHSPGWVLWIQEGSLTLKGNFHSIVTI